MTKYRVTMYGSWAQTVEVDADDEAEARMFAECELDVNQISTSPEDFDVEEIEDKEVKIVRADD